MRENEFAKRAHICTEYKRFSKEFKEQEERKTRESKYTQPISASQLHKYVFYGGKPIRRNSSF